MLGSLSPLGQRARNSNWGVTASSYVVGSVATASLTGLILGGSGAIIAHLVGTDRFHTVALLALALGALWGFSLDAGLLAVPLPTRHRQVRGSWRSRYRGWVYGLGYGAILGLGVATVVTTAAVYLTLAAEFFSATPAEGLMIGAVFGGVRAATTLASAGVREAGDFESIDATLRRWAPTSRIICGWGQGLIGTALVALTLGLLLA